MDQTRLNFYFPARIINNKKMNFLLFYDFSNFVKKKIYLKKKVNLKKTINLNFILLNKNFLKIFYF